MKRLPTELSARLSVLWTKSPNRPMLKIQRSDQSDLAKVLTDAFQRDPVLRWIIQNNEQYDRIGIPYFELILNHSLKFDSNYTNEHKNAVALWTEPGETTSLLAQLLSTLRLIVILRGQISRAYQLQELMASYRPKQECLQLNYLATSPDSRGKGHGASLLRPMLDQSMQNGVPVYLECSNQENLGFYKQFGFRLIDMIQLNAGPSIWPMVLEPEPVKIPL